MSRTTQCHWDPQVLWWFGLSIWDRVIMGDSDRYKWYNPGWATYGSHIESDGMLSPGCYWQEIDQRQQCLTRFKEAAMSPHLLLSLGFAAHAAGILKWVAASSFWSFLYTLAKSSVDLHIDLRRQSSLATWLLSFSTFVRSMLKHWTWKLFTSHLKRTALLQLKVTETGKVCETPWVWLCQIILF